MYYNPEYMNPIMKGLNQPSQPQQGIASLAPTPPTQGIHNQQFIDPGVGQFRPPTDFTMQPRTASSDPNAPNYNPNFNPPSSAYSVGPPDPSAPTDQFGNTIGWNPPPINLFPSQPPGYQPPGVQPGVGTFDHLTDNPYAAGPPDDFITIEGVRHYVGGSTQQTPTPPQNFQPAIPQPGTGMPNPQPGMPFNPNPGTPYGVQGIHNQEFIDPGVGQFNPNQGIASLAGTNPGI